MKEKLILISDTHISNWTGQFNEEAFKAGVELVASELRSSDANRTEIIHLGDITDEGVFVDYSYADEVITKEFAWQGFPKLWEQTHKIPGNHDVRNVGNTIWESFYGKRDFLVELENLVIMGIDSCEPDQNGGKVGDRGLEEILRLQPYSEDKRTVLCLHHHLVPIPNTGRERSTILDAGDVIDVVFEAGVDVVVTGHRHHPHSYTLARGGHKLIVINSGTFSANKTRALAGHSFAVLEFEDQQLNIRFQGIDDYSLYRVGVQSTETLTKDLVGHGSEGSLITRIVQISDTHFSKGPAFLKDIFQQGIKAIKDEKPDLVIHCGNLTNDAYTEDYAIARPALKELQPIPLLVVPGPLDLYPLGKELFIEKIGSLDPLMEIMDLHVVGLTTGSENPGILGRARMSRIEEEKNRTNKPLVVVMHHSPLPVPRTKLQGTLLDAGSVLFFLTNLVKVPLVLTGMDHFGHSVKVHDTVFVNCGTFSNPKVKSRRLYTYNSISLYDNGVIRIEEVEIISQTRHDLGWFQLPELWAQISGDFSEESLIP